MGACYGCGKMGHKLSECLSDANRGKEGRPQGQVAQGGQVQQGAQQAGAQRNIRFYVVHARQDVESPDVVMGILRVFNFDVYPLLDPSAN